MCIRDSGLSISNRDDFLQSIEKSCGLPLSLLNSILLYYSLVPITRHGTIIQNSSSICPYTFSKIWGVSFNWINTQFWSTSRGTFDKNNLAPIAYTFVGVSINWSVTFSMPWGVTINWNMSSNWNQRVHTNLFNESYSKFY